MSPSNPHVSPSEREDRPTKLPATPAAENPFQLDYKQLVLTLGYRCNMNCKSCFIGDKLSDHETVLTYTDCVDIIETAAHLQTIESVAFVGGEPFVYYKLMLKLATYIHTHYRCPLNITTNASWARSQEMTARLLDPLVHRGLRYVMVSLDEYHLEFGTIQNAANCLRRCLEHGIETTVQVIDRVGAPNAADFKEAIGDAVDVDAIKWYENPCAAIGNAATMLESEDLQWFDEIPGGGCNAGSILNVQPDGEIKPCCGAGLMAPRLSLGNGKKEGVHEAVQRSEADPIINSLISEQGPRGLAEVLRAEGRDDLVEKHAPFTDACYACHAFLTDPEVLDVLERVLASRRVETLAQRVLSLHGVNLLQELSS